MAHAQKPDFVFRWNGRVHLNRPEGASVQSTTGSRGVRISGSNAGYTMFRGSVKSTGYPLHQPGSPSLPLLCVTVYHHISTGVYPLYRRLGRPQVRYGRVRKILPPPGFDPRTVHSVAISWRGQGQICFFFQECMLQKMNCEFSCLNTCCLSKFYKKVEKTVVKWDASLAANRQVFDILKDEDGGQRRLSRAQLLITQPADYFLTLNNNNNNTNNNNNNNKSKSFRKCVSNIPGKH